MRRTPEKEARDTEREDKRHARRLERRAASARKHEALKPTPRMR